MTCNCNPSRRGFLKGAALGAAAVSITPILARTARGANAGTPGRFLVVVNLLGGNDGLNMVIPTKLSSYVTRRPDINLIEHLPAGRALHALNADYSLHYELPYLKGLWDDGDLHVVHKVSYPNPNQSHFTSMDIYSYGVRNDNPDGRGWLGRFADAFCANPVEPLGVVSVGLGRRPDFESAVTAPLILNSVSTFRVDTDTEFASDHDLRVRTVKDTLGTDPSPPLDPALTIFGTNKQAYELVERVQAETAGWVDPGTYPDGLGGRSNTAIGRFLKTVSQLLHAHDTFQTRVFYTGFGGFDTHTDQHAEAGTNRHAGLMLQLNNGLQAFIEDMKAKNKWNSCTVVVISEFGRRNYQNGTRGTDHGWGNAFLVMGGQVQGQFTGSGGVTGQLVETDIANNNQLPFGYDFRDIYGKVLTRYLGLPQDQVTGLFPDPGYNPSFNDIGV